MKPDPVDDSNLILALRSTYNGSSDVLDFPIYFKQIDALALVSEVSELKEHIFALTDKVRENTKELKGLKSVVAQLSGGQHAQCLIVNSSAATKCNACIVWNHMMLNTIHSPMTVSEDCKVITVRETGFYLISCQVCPSNCSLGKCYLSIVDPANKNAILARSCPYSARIDTGSPAGDDGCALIMKIRMKLHEHQQFSVTYCCSDAGVEPCSVDPSENYLLVTKI